MVAAAVVAVAINRKGNMEKHTIVCGFGHVGYRILILLAQLREPAVVIYDKAPADWLQWAKHNNIVCLEGDARSSVLLEKADIGQAKASIAATDRDEANLSIAMDARQLNPNAAVVVRLYDQLLAPHLEESLGIRRALSDGRTTSLQRDLAVPC